MQELDKLLLLSKIEEALKEIPTPPQGRNIAIVNTKLQEAKLWLLADIKKLL